jgi:hypothetical protein
MAFPSVDPTCDNQIDLLFAYLRANDADWTMGSPTTILKLWAFLRSMENHPKRATMLRR